MDLQTSNSGGVVPVVRWSSPTFSFIKINVDASWNALIGYGIVGTVVRNAEGKFMVAARYMIKAWSAAQAKALAFLHGCQRGISLGHKLVIMESDSLESISSLRDSLENGSWEAYATLAKVKRLGKSFQDCR